ncbi:MAG: hypothetical protein V4503_11700 [Gemmatimonadota bacterium]
MDFGRSHLAGELSRRRASHPVGHEVEHPAFADLVFFEARVAARFRGGKIGNEEGVLVVIPGLAAVGEREGG